MYMKPTLAAEAIAEQEVLYLDGVRYYTREGQLHLKPRGKFSTMKFTPEGIVFQRVSGRKPFIISTSDFEFDSTTYKPKPGTGTKLFGLNDIWFSTVTPKKPEVQSALHSSSPLEVVKAQEWIEKRLDAGKPLILDMKLVFHPLGVVGGGRGKSARPSSIKILVDVDPDTGVETPYYLVNFSNYKSQLIERDLSAGVLDDRIAYTADDYLYDPLPILHDQDIYISGPNLAFTSKELAEQWADLGLIPEPLDSKGLARTRAKAERHISNALDEYGFSDEDKQRVIPELFSIINRSL